MGNCLRAQREHFDPGVNCIQSKKDFSPTNQEHRRASSQLNNIVTPNKTEVFTHNSSSPFLVHNVTSLNGHSHSLPRGMSANVLDMRRISDLEGSPRSTTSHERNRNFRTPSRDTLHERKPSCSSISLLKTDNTRSPQRINMMTRNYGSGCIVGCSQCKSVEPREFLSNDYVAIFGYNARTDEEISLGKGDNVAVLTDK